MPVTSLLPLALGVGLLFVASSASAKKKKPTPGGSTPLFPGQPPAPPPEGTPPLPGQPPLSPGGSTSTPGSGVCELDAHMPDAVKQTTRQMLTNPGVPRRNAHRGRANCRRERLPDGCPVLA